MEIVDAYSGNRLTQQWKNNYYRNALRKVLLIYIIYEEPYYILLEEGYEIPAPPTLDDYLIMLEKSS